MGLTTIEVEIANVAHPEKREKLELLVDSGAIYSVIPGEIVRKLRIRAYEKESFSLANGDRIERRIGDAIFFLKKRRGPSKIIIGEPGDSAILGVITLESLGFALDPIRRELRPRKMVLM